MPTTLQSIAPASGRVLGSVSPTELDSISEHVAKACSAQSEWKRHSFAKRSVTLISVADKIEEEASELSLLLCEESGKILAQAEFEVRITIEFLRRIAKQAVSFTSTEIPTAHIPSIASDQIEVKRVPFGLVAAILPFNFPVELYVEKVAAALAMGNGVIVKAPPQTPLIVQRLTDLFHQSGIPSNLLHCLHGGREVGEALGNAKGIDLYSLTGSTLAGVSLARAAAPRLPKLHLELGGNDPAILLEDADLDLAVPQLIFGRTLMNGQACASNKRILVHRSLHDRLAERLSKELAAIEIGDPLQAETQLGPMIDEAAAQKVVSQVRHAIDQGGRLIFGDLESRGSFVSPFLLGEVPASADVAKDDEIFGPVLPLIPFDTDQEAIAIANQSSFGLSSGVFSSDWKRAESVADQIEAGGTVINGTGNYRPYIVPFGGVKMSGLGREGLGYTLEEMSQLRYTVWRNPPTGK